MPKKTDQVLFRPVIGLEIHVELKTVSKMFCQCDANYFGAEPNTHTCPVCLGLPGALPVPNRKAVEWAIRIGLALGCKINLHSKFDRKHYSYPDLPKGYQISQYDEPLAVDGSVPLMRHLPDGSIEKTTFRITRVHLEEDTGKLIHKHSDTFVDFNRSGVPLVEIVTEPDFDNPDDVKAFLEDLHTIIEYLEVSDANMEEGSMRLEPNISVMMHTSVKNPPLPDYKVEVKNINSFSYVKKAIEYEVVRQSELLKAGKKPPQETRGFKEADGSTFPQRSKEEAQDYRYFPEPDIPPMRFQKKEIERIRKNIPELPHEKIIRYISMGVRFRDAYIITRSKDQALYFEKIIAENRISELTPEKIATILVNKKINPALSVPEFLKHAADRIQPHETDTAALTSAVNTVLNKHRKAVSDYRSGKTNALMFLLGQVMRLLGGKADAHIVTQAIKKALEKT